MRAKRLFSVWDVWCVDKNGRELWREHVTNLLHDEGEEFIVKTMFPETKSVPTTYYMLIDDRVTIAEADTLPPTGEPSVGGYARQPINSDATDFTAVQDSGDWQVTTKTVSWTPSGADLPSVRNLGFAETLNDTGAFISSVALSAPRVVKDGDTLNASMIIKMSE